MEKILSVSLKLIFTPNSPGCYGLKGYKPVNGFVILDHFKLGLSDY